MVANVLPLTSTSSTLCVPKNTALDQQQDGQCIMVFAAMSDGLNLNFGTYLVEIEN